MICVSSKVSRKGWHSQSPSAAANSPLRHFLCVVCLWLIRNERSGAENVMSCGRSRPVRVCFCGRTSTRKASGVRAASASRTASAGLVASAAGAPSASPNGSGSPGTICDACSRRRAGAQSGIGVRSASCPWSCFLIGALCWSGARPASCACSRCSICERSHSEARYDSKTRSA